MNTRTYRNPLKMNEYRSNATVEQIAQRIVSASRVLLTTHVKPDGDGIGSALAMWRALEQKGVKADIYMMGPVETRLRLVAGDTPFFPADLVARLADAARSGGQPIALAATNDPERGLSEHPTFGLWPVDLADNLHEALTVGNMRKIIVWTSRHGCARAVFDEAGEFPFFNVNTPEDIIEAERILKEHA